MGANRASRVVQGGERGANRLKKLAALHADARSEPLKRGFKPVGVPFRKRFEKCRIARYRLVQKLHRFKSIFPPARRVNDSVVYKFFCSQV